MGIMDKVKDAMGKGGDKAKDSGMTDKAKDMVDKGGDAVDEKTGGKFASGVDKGQDMANDEIDKMGS